MLDIGSLGLSRKPDQSLVIGDTQSEFFAIVTIRRMDGNKVWLNVSAPKGVKVLRGELFNANRGI